MKNLQGKIARHATVLILDSGDCATLPQIPRSSSTSPTCRQFHLPVRFMWKPSQCVIHAFPTMVCYLHLMADMMARYLIPPVPTLAIPVVLFKLILMLKQL